MQISIERSFGTSQNQPTEGGCCCAYLMTNNNSLPFDTSKYDDLPISTVIYEPVFDDDANLKDYRILYANAPLKKDWDIYRPGEPCIGSCILKTSVMNQELLRLMHEHFHKDPPKAFSYYVPEGDIHVHFQPMPNLPPPYVGYFLTNVSEYEAKSAKMHFLRSIRQIENAAVLLRQKDTGEMETILVSDEFTKMMECADNDEAVKMMTGNGFILCTHPDDRLSVRRMFRRRMSENHTKELTIRKVTAKGNKIWCNVHYAFIDDFGEHYIYCTYFDVTTSRVYAQRLQTSYTSIGDNFYRENEYTLGMFRVNLTRDIIEDMKGKDLFATDSMIRSYTEVIKLRSQNYPIKHEQARFIEMFHNQRLIDFYIDGKIQLSEYLFSRRKDGRLCYVKFAVMLTRHPISGEIIAFISESEASHEKVENALLDKILVRQFDMVAFIVNGKYGVVLGDSSLIGKGSIFPISRNGIYKDYLDNQVLPVLSGDPEQRKTMAESLLLETIDNNVTPDKPYIVNIACEIDGEVYYKRLDFYRTDPDVAFFILLKSDTTEIQRKQIERNDRLREALKEAKAASVAKTAFLSRMSHEIRTPMNAIIGLDNIALHEPDLSDSLRKYLNQIGQSARYLLSLINDILDMSRIESGRMTIKNEEFIFNQFLEQIKIIVEGQCRDKGLHFHLNIVGNIDQFYIGDDTKLKQILINILGNSVKFTDVGGDITLTVECTGKYEGHSNLRFIMQDTGIGMDKEYLPKIFEAFSQEDSTNTSTYGGSGLGLAITKNIVEMMNGTVTVDSVKGVGSTFTVNLPLKNSQRQLENSDDISPQDLNVLIIDDDPVSCDLTKTVLADAGISSDICFSGEEALGIIKLTHARREEYNLILVDLHMPHQNGIEVTRSIRKILGDTPTVIIFTAYDIFEFEKDAIEAGVDGFMSKPLSAANLLYEIRQIFNRRRAEKESAKVIPADLEGRRILVAEDMMVNAEIIMMLLEMRDMEADHAINGKAVVEMFAKSEPHYYDAILMDVRMPEMDGLEAATAIRALNHPDAQSIPIIAMTANAFDEDVQRSLQAGMNAHLSKPVEPEHMYQTLEELIGKNLAQRGE